MSRAPLAAAAPGPARALRAAVARLLPGGSLRARVAHGALWSLVATCMTQGAALAGSVLAARVLGTTDFGRLGMIRSTLLMLGVLAGTGLGLAATKYVAELRSSDPARAGSLLGLLFNVGAGVSGVVTLLALVFATPLAALVLDDPRLAGPLRVGALLLFLSTVGGVQYGALVGLEAFRVTAWMGAAEGVAALVFTVGGALAFGLPGAVAGTVAASALAVALKHAALGRACRAAGIAVSHRRAGSELRALWGFVLPAVLVGLSAQPAEWLARLLLVRGPGGYAELGLFTAAYALGQVVQMVPAQVTGASLPVLAHTFAEGSRARMTRLLGFTVLLALGLAVAAALPLALAARLVLGAYGAGFVHGRAVLLVMLAAYAVASLSGLLRSVLAATGRMWWQMLHALIWSATLLAVTYALRGQGALGLALGYLAAFAVAMTTQATSAYFTLRTMPE